MLSSPAEMLCVLSKIIQPGMLHAVKLACARNMAISPHNSTQIGCLARLNGRSGTAG
jgi:hypothetical protein